VIHVPVRGKFTYEWESLYEDVCSPGCAFLTAVDCGMYIQFEEEFDQCTLGKRRLKVNEFGSEVAIIH
jgi:hypothetical protein